MSFAGRCHGGPLPWTCVASLLIAVTEIIKEIRLHIIYEKFVKVIATLKYIFNMVTIQYITQSKY